MCEAWEGENEKEKNYQIQVLDTYFDLVLLLNGDPYKSYGP